MPLVVAQQPLDAGSQIERGDLLLELIQLDPLIAVLMVSEQQFGQLQLGQEVILRGDAWPQQQFRHRASFCSSF